MMTTNEAVQLAHDLHAIVSSILVNDIQVDAKVSRRALVDVVIHWDADMTKLMNSQKNGVRPSKYIGYLSFWFRKLKPISGAYETSALLNARATGQMIAPMREIADI